MESVQPQLEQESQVQSQYPGINNFFKALLKSLRFLIILIISPLRVWLKSIDEMAAINTKTNNFKESDSKWPVFSFIRIYLFDSGLSFLCFISYFVGLAVAIIIANQCYHYNGERSIFDFVYPFIGNTMITYIVPFGIKITKDILDIIIVKPVMKYISWIEKPAQYLDITMDNKNK